MGNKHVTLMIISQPTAKVRTLRFRRSTFTVAGLLLVAFIAVATFLAVGYAGQRIQQSDLKSLQERNQILNRELANMRMTLEGCQAQMTEHVRLEEQLRLFANLDPIPEEVRLMGVGGSDWHRAASMEALSSTERADLNDIGSRVDLLARQTRLQRESLTQVEKTLAEDREKWARTPSIRPVDSGYMSSGFGRRVDPFTGRMSMHWGVDYCTWEGEPVYATADGIVVESKSDRGFGKIIKIDHGNGYTTFYAHNKENKVKKGQEVKRGDVIALVGDSGRSTGPHLHYEVRLDGKALNPWKYVLSDDYVVD